MRGKNNRKKKVWNLMSLGKKDSDSGAYPHPCRAPDANGCLLNGNHPLLFFLIICYEVSCVDGCGGVVVVVVVAVVVVVVVVV